MKEFLHIEITTELRDKILEQSKKEYTNMSALVRKAIRFYIEMEKDNPYSPRKLNSTFDKAIRRTMVEKGLIKVEPVLSDEEKNFEESLKESL